LCIFIVKFFILLNDKLDYENNKVQKMILEFKELGKYGKSNGEMFG
jgi:hypothetical protein